MSNEPFKHKENKPKTDKLAKSFEVKLDFVQTSRSPEKETVKIGNCCGENSQTQARAKPGRKQQQQHQQQQQRPRWPRDQRG